MSTTTELTHAGSGAQMQIVHTPASAGRAALTPTSYADMFRLAEAMHKSAMFGVRNPEQAMVVLMTGLELGFSPAQAFRGIHVINNKPTLSADMMVAVCKSRPDVCRFFRLVESTDESATYETHRVGEPEPVAITFTAAAARRAGLTSNPTWTKFPSQMCRARAASGLTRAVYPDLILGLYDPDEAENIPAPPEQRYAPPEQRYAPSEPPARRAPVDVTPPPAATADPVNSEDALRAERKEKVARLTDLLKGTPTEYREGLKARCLEKYGIGDVRNLGLDTLDELYAEVKTELFPAASEPAPEAETPPEDDPFADAPDAQPALMAAPEAGPGHARS